MACSSCPAESQSLRGHEYIRMSSSIAVHACAVAAEQFCDGALHGCGGVCSRTVAVEAMLLLLRYFEIRHDGTRTASL